MPADPATTFGSWPGMTKSAICRIRRSDASSAAVSWTMPTGTRSTMVSRQLAQSPAISTKHSAGAHILLQRAFEPFFRRLLTWANKARYPGRIVNPGIYDDFFIAAHDRRGPDRDLDLLAEVTAINLR